MSNDPSRDLLDRWLHRIRSRDHEEFIRMLKRASQTPVKLAGRLKPGFELRDERARSSLTASRHDVGGDEATEDGLGG